MDEPGAIIEACRAGVDLFVAAAGRAGVPFWSIARVDAMSEAYLERVLREEPERYAGVFEVARILNVSRQRVSELRTRTGFPAPVAELAAGPVWKVSTLRSFLAEWTRKPGRPRREATG